MELLLLPVWLLALPVTWHRSARMPKRFRLSLLACVTVGIAALAQGLNFWILAAKVGGLDRPLALHYAHLDRTWSWVLFALSLASCVMFAFFFVRGTRVANQR
jgi:hypothetical protein